MSMKIPSKRLRHAPVAPTALPTTLPLRSPLAAVASLAILLGGVPLTAQSSAAHRSPGPTAQQQPTQTRTSLASPDRPRGPQGDGPVIGTQPAQNVPTLSQIGSSTALVPMKHGSCGPQCATHVLAVQSGNLDMKLQVGMSCPAGASVTHLSFKPQGQNATSVVAYDTGQAAFSKTLLAQPFSKDDLQAGCQQALGGAWVPPNTHSNTSSEVKKTIVKSVKVWGQCAGWANKASRTYPVSLTLTCRDQSFVVPVG